MAGATVSVTVVGGDREGVVAAFTGFAFRQGGNIESVSQNVMNGLFGMHMEVSLPEGADAGAFDRGVRELAAEHGMEASAHREDGGDKSVAVFVTREPHCLEALLGAGPGLGGRISVVVGTEGTLAGAAARAGVPFVEAGGGSQAEAEEALLAACREHDVDLIVLARYMRILTPNFVWRYPNRIINIHPSLLPAFPGAGAYAQAFERGAKIAGVTAHYVTESLDQGPIILQDSFAVDPGDTLDEIRARGQGLEAGTLLRAVRMHLGGKLDVRWRKVHVRRR